MKTSAIDGMLVAPEWASAVVSPAYDALDEKARRSYVMTHPESFLSALPTGDTNPAVLERCAHRITELRNNGRFITPPSPFAAIARVSERGVSLTGLVMDVPIGEFGTAIKGHEKTRPDRVDSLTEFLRVVGIASSPVVVAHQPSPSIDQLVGMTVEQPPFLDAIGADGAEMTLWILKPEAAVAAMETVDQGIIVDGHHRTAAALAAGAEAVLCSFVTADKLGATGFDRISDTTVTDLPDRLEEAGFTVKVTDLRDRPETTGRVHICWNDSWYVVSGWDNSLLDAEVVDEQILGGVLGVSNFEVHPGTGAVPKAPLVVTSHPPAWSTLESMVEEGRTMPPKSTYFTPKMRSGVFLVDRRP